METPTLTDVRTVAISVVDQDRAVAFYVEELGFELRLDASIGNGLRWIEVAPQGATTSIALASGRERPGAEVDTGIRLSTGDAAQEHANMQHRAVDVDELLRWPNVPLMSRFRDPDGNVVYVVEQTS